MDEPNPFLFPHCLSSGCHHKTLVKMKMLVVHSCPTLCDTMGCNPPGSSGILQARRLGWVAISFSRGIFPIQGLNLGFPRGRQILYHLSHHWVVNHQKLIFHSSGGWNPKIRVLSGSGSAEGNLPVL